VCVFLCVCVRVRVRVRVRVCACVYTYIFLDFTLLIYTYIYSKNAYYLLRYLTCFTTLPTSVSKRDFTTSLTLLILLTFLHHLLCYITLDGLE
jgi:hypothetical protein